MLPVVLHLDAPPAIGLLDGPPHGLGDVVGIHDHLAIHVAGRPADGLDEGRLAPQETLLVGIQDGHQRDLRQVQALS